MRRETFTRIATPTAILVAVPEGLVPLCSDTLADGGLRVLKVGHVAAASERIPVVMPQLVLVGAELHPDELEMMTDRCVAVGAVLIQVDASASGSELVAALKHAAREALNKALSGR